jgi:hypothetical protein
MNRRSLLLLAVFVSGCAATGPVYRPVENVDPGNALVYVYRGTGFALGGRTAYFYVDGVNVFDLDQGGYSWVSLPPGRYKFKQSWPVDIPARSTELDLEVRAGETQYFSFQTGTCQGGYREICVQWEFRHQPPDSGRAAIADKRFQKNFGAAKLRLQLDGKP